MPFHIHTGLVMPEACDEECDEDDDDEDEEEMEEEEEEEMEEEEMEDHLDFDLEVAADEEMMAINLPDEIGELGSEILGEMMSEDEDESEDAPCSPIVAAYYY